MGIPWSSCLRKTNLCVVVCSRTHLLETGTRLGGSRRIPVHYAGALSGISTETCSYPGLTKRAARSHCPSGDLLNIKW